MKDVELVIKIPEEQYHLIKVSHKAGIANHIDKEGMMYAIKNGTLLPKGHGDLIDRDEILNWSYKIDSKYCMYDEVVNVDDIKHMSETIKASSNEEKLIDIIKDIKPK